MHACDNQAIYSKLRHHKKPAWLVPVMTQTDGDAMQSTCICDYDTSYTCIYIYRHAYIPGIYGIYMV